MQAHGITGRPSAQAGEVLSYPRLFAVLVRFTFRTERLASARWAARRPPAGRVRRAAHESPCDGQSVVGDGANHVRIFAGMPVTSNRPSSVAIVTSRLPVPNGMAATVRAVCFGRMVAEAGGSARILVAYPTEPVAGPTDNTASRGQTCGIDFEYTCGSTRTAATRRGRTRQKVRGTAVLVWRLWSLRRAARLDAVFLYTDALRLVLVVAALARLLSVPLAMDESELPFHDRAPLWGALLRRLQLPILYALFEGIVVVSPGLEDLVRRYARSRVRILRIPALTDCREFVVAGKASPETTIVYAGALSEAKDGVLTLVEAFARVAGRRTGPRLVLAGEATDPGEPSCLEVAGRLGVGQSVTVLPRVPRARLVELLTGASLLVHARPASPQADYGFSTKLVEFLASGTPVVTTVTGQAGGLLEDGRTAFLARGSDAGSIASAIERALANPDEAARVGRRGRELAEREFDYRAHGERFAAFLSSLTAPV
jgi:glycosyltransferase involved in cell wall biosynthesis